VIKSKQICSLLGSALLAGGSLSAQNLIIQGDFENGIITGSGLTSGTYRHELGTFLPERRVVAPFTNNSNWVISDTYNTARFIDLNTPTEGWAVRMGNYSSGPNLSSVTYAVPLDLAEGDYLFSALHWGGISDPVQNIDPSDPPTGTSFTATLTGVGSTAGTDQVIGTFIDTTLGSAQTSGGIFTLNTAGTYQLQLSPSASSDGRAWLDDISLTAVPEPSSFALLFGLSSLFAALYLPRKKNHHEI
jgi:hypothetical protein